MELKIVSSNELSKNDFRVINKFRSQEFGVDIPSNSISSNEDQDSFYFLLKVGDNLLAFALLEELPLKFRHESVLVLFVSTVIATQKGRGYGVRVLTEIQKYAKEKGRTLLGFCETDIIPYYQKCGFRILSNEENQFVYVDENDVVIPNIVPGEVFYIDGSDQIFKRILSNRDKRVRVRRPRTA